MIFPQPIDLERNVFVFSRGGRGASLGLARLFRLERDGPVLSLVLEQLLDALVGLGQELLPALHEASERFRKNGAATLQKTGGSL